MPAIHAGELRRAFGMGFLLRLPFLVMGGVGWLVPHSIMPGELNAAERVLP